MPDAARPPEQRPAREQPRPRELPYSDAEIALLARTLQAGAELAPAAQQALLDALPPEHARLRPVLAAMLAEPPAADDDTRWRLPPLDVRRPPAIAAGQWVGPYRLLRPVGEGGMATVWLAERADGVFERRVALKLPRIAGSPALAARIEREKQIAARLEHPAIARLYDAGVWNGQPYIAMEYVDGVPVEQWCAAPGRTPAQVLRLFAALARAVEHAHRRQVVHRDIKPANIVVAETERPCLLDFGIATIVEGEAAGAGALTQEFGRAMTRRYASPEQVLGQPVGPASDIYSLGVTLFELLAGSSPYVTERDTPAALEEAIVQGATLPASVRRRALRGDVEAILAKALQREPARRYASAGALADDIERHLAGLPPAARRLRWPAHLLRRARAHAPALALAGGALLALAGAALLVTGRLVRDDPAPAHASEVAAFVAELFRAHAGNRATAQPVEDLLEARFGTRPALHAEMLRALATAYLDVGASRQAGELAARHLALLERTQAAPRERARALLLLGQASSAQSRHTEGIARLRQAVALLPPGRDDDLALFARASLAMYLVPAGRLDEARAIIAAVDAEVPLARRPPSAGLARLVDVQGALLELDNRFEDALAHWRRAVDLALRAEGPSSREAVRIRVRMALDLVGHDRVDEALPVLQAATEVMRAAGALGEVRAAVITARLMNNAFYMGLVPPARVLAALDQAAAAAAAAGPMLPPSVRANVEVLQGAVAMRRGDLASARRLLAPALPVARAATDGLIDRRWLVTYEAAVAMHGGEHARAEPLLQERLRLRVQSGAGSSPYAAFDWVQLAHNAVMQGDLARAEAVLRQAPRFAPLQGVPGRGDAAYAHAVAEQWARLHLRRGDAAAALAALPPDYGLGPEEDRAEQTLAPYALRGEVLCAAGRAAEGLPYLERSIVAVGSVAHPASPGLARLRALWGLCRLAQGDVRDAASAARLARQGFAQQPEVSPWYRLPLQQLEQALARRHSPGDVRIRAAPASVPPSTSARP